MDSAQSVDSKIGIIFENRQFISWHMSKMLNKYAIIKKFVARNFLRFLSLFYYIYRQNLLILSKKPAASRKSTLGFVDILAKSRKKLKKEKKIFLAGPRFEPGTFCVVSRCEPSRPRRNWYKVLYKNGHIYWTTLYKPIIFEPLFSRPEWATGRHFLGRGPAFSGPGKPCICTASQRN